MTSGSKTPVKPKRANLRAALDQIRLRFSDPDVERAFRVHERANNLIQIRLAFILIIILSTGFAILDPFIFSKHGEAILWLRLGVVNVIVVIATILSYRDFWRTRWPALAAFVELMFAVFVGVSAYLGAPNPMFVAGLPMLILAAYVLLPLIFIYQLVVGLLSSGVLFGLIFAANILSDLELALFSGVLLMANTVGIFGLYRIERFRRLEFLTLQAIDDERGRYQDLLVQILPRQIADRLQSGEKGIVDNYEDVTIMFADIVGFTDLAARHPATTVLNLLSEIFARFDVLAEHHGVEKIKTIGDSFMTAAGVPDAKSNHAELSARLALDMLRAISDLRDPDGAPVRLRIGMDSGPVIGGVIGEARFLYDLWGDTVNTASRMTSLCRPDAIQISENVHDRLSDDLTVSAPEIIEVKGKGAMTTFLVIGETSQGLN